MRTKIFSRFKFISTICCGVVFAFLFFSFQAQPEIKNQIQWSADRPLTWDDFKGSQPANAKFAALTSANIHYDFVVDGDSVLINVYCYFDEKQSKVKKADRTNELLLTHEQYHFHIAELYTRKLRKELTESVFTKANYNNEYVKIHNKYVKKCDSDQDKYDNETEHSIKTDKQLQWQQKVDGELSDLQAYSWTSKKFLLK